MGVTPGYQQKCTPATQIVFVKTHKTGSTTTASMLERYGQKHSLIFALPKKNHIFSTTELFNRNMVTKIEFGITLNGNIVNGYNILTNHARYNRPEMDAVIPNAAFVTILREPTAQLESAFGYFHLADGWGLENTSNALAMFMKAPKAYFEKPFLFSHLSFNAQLYDLGLDHQFHSDRFKVDCKIRQLENEFDLVMILEYYDESLILLKQVLCLEYDDIIYIKLAQRQQRNKYDVSPKLREQMRRWNRNDARLYNHFNTTFWKKINANKKQFDKELREFHNIQDEVTKRCVEHVTLNDGSTKRQIPLNSSKDEVRFCKRIYKGDVPFVKDLRQQYIELGLIKPQEM
ncbi:galactosylceramide sulfotransferase-like [Anneissia japonica]|uniref:galactosylceramide sulfotransferase-like n=1 Tax=Anneissia japonica TaxID=1529436 RepID=UPI0014255F76|nr:galactosylceramide sulfotransferase-like [Anneissia japonica]